MNAVDVLVIGAGPAGMAAAIEARRSGLDVLVVDDQPSPGGQIWRSVEVTRRNDGVLGEAYVQGRAITEAFRASGARYDAGTQLWQIEPGYRAFLSRDGEARAIEAAVLILATGAQERPVPFPGWTLPGVLTVGAAQILLKTAGQIPVGPVWIAGSGPLPLLYAVQLIQAGGELAGYLDTTPHGRWTAALPHLPNALRASGDLLKGLGWTRSIRKSDTAYVRAANGIVALGAERLEALRYRSGDGDFTTANARTVLVHEGVVPSIHAALSLGCDMEWNAAQDCFAPKLDNWGESTRENLFIAGDGAGIAGAKAALLRGQLAGLRAAVRLGRLTEASAAQRAGPVRRRLKREMAARPFLDALFRPRPEVFSPTDETIVCRCEEVTAGSVRQLARVGRPGPNQIKAASRVGMGPCQGRQCGYTMTRLIGEVQQRSPGAVGYLNIRPPLRPVTLGELAAVEQRIMPAPPGIGDRP